MKTPDPFSDEIDLSDVMSPSVADIVKVKDRKLEKLFAAEIDDDGRPIRGSSALSQTLSDVSDWMIFM